MDNLDILIIIHGFASDRDIIMYLSTTKRLHQFKNRFQYTTPIRYSKIKQSSYFNNFTSIIIGSNDLHTKWNIFRRIIYEIIGSELLDKVIDIAPEHINSLSIFNIFRNFFPKKLFHLIYDDDYNDSFMMNADNIIHLTFGTKFSSHRQLMENFYGNITYLTFGRNFNQPLSYLDESNSIVNIIPPKITHLTFGDNFNQPLLYQIPGMPHIPSSIIPDSVTHLIFGCNFNQPIEYAYGGETYYAYNNVTHLTFGNFFAFIFINKLPTSVTHLTLYGQCYKLNLKYLVNLEKLFVPFNDDVKVRPECKVVIITMDKLNIKN